MKYFYNALYRRALKTLVVLFILFGNYFNAQAQFPSIISPTTGDYVSFGEEIDLGYFKFTSAPQTFTFSIQNAGAAILNFQGVPGAPVSQPTVSPVLSVQQDGLTGVTSLSPFETRTFKIIVTPAVQGTFTSVFEIEFDDPFGSGIPVLMQFSVKAIVNIKSNQTIPFTNLDLPAKEYGDPTFTLPLKTSAGLTVSYTSSNTTVATISGNTVTILAVGYTDITATQAGDATFNPALTKKNILIVNKALLTATVDNKTRAYGDANPTTTITYTGFKNGENISVIDTKPVAVTNSSATSIAGAGTIHSISLNGGGDNNYIISSVNGTLTITQAVLTATADDKTRAYGDANPTATITYAGFKNGENAAVIDTPPTISYTATTTTNVGISAIGITGGLDNNYTFNVVDGMLTITKAVLTVTADDKTRAYGDANPTATITYAGFKNGENASVIDTPPTVSHTAINTISVGTAIISIAGGSDNNYAFNLVDGVLTITKTVLTATADDKTRAYGDANPTATITYTGFKNGEDISVIDTTPVANFIVFATSDVGTYSTIWGTGAVDNNYTFNLVNGTLTITKAVLIATADDKTRAYGDANPSTTITYTGFKNGENISVIDTPPIISYTANPASNVGTSAIGLTGGSDNNYTFNLVNGTLSITKAIIAARADNKTRKYKESNPPLSITYTGFKNGETESVLDAKPSIVTIATTSSNAGSYPITLNGGNDNNYNITLEAGTLLIQKADQAITFNPISTKNINEADFLLAASSSSGLNIVYTITGPATLVGNSTNTVHLTRTTGTVTISASQPGDGNYNAAVSVQQSFEVNDKLPQTITFVPLAERILGDVPFTLSASASSNLAVTFTSSNLNVVTINGNIASLIGAGEATITATQVGNSQYAAATAVSRVLVVKLISATEPLNNNSFEMYPNPSTDYLIVDGTVINDSYTFNLVDNSGKTVMPLAVEIVYGHKYKIDVHSLIPGIYFLQVYQEERVIEIKRFVKK